MLMRKILFGIVFERMLLIMKMLRTMMKQMLMKKMSWILLMCVLELQMSCYLSNDVSWKFLRCCWNLCLNLRWCWSMRW